MRSPFLGHYGFGKIDGKTLVDLLAGESPHLNARTVQNLCELILIWSSLG
jgi:hypothetical protein